MPEHRADTLADYEHRILRVLVHIQTHLDAPGSLEELAAIATFSPFHFHRIFSGMVGEGVMEHIRRLRLERAAHRLQFTQQQIAPIALEAGFESHEAFTRAFKDLFGTTPSDFRTSRRDAQPPTAPSGVRYCLNGRVETFRPLKGDPMQVRIETIRPQRVAFIRHTGPYEDAGAAWSRLMSWAGPRGLLGARPFGLSYDDPAVTPGDKLRYDACLPVAATVPTTGEVGIHDVAGGRYAVAEHVGPYERLGETYAKLFGQWMPASGNSPRADPCIERYLNDPRSTLPEQLRTEACAPIV